jgi:cobaltochelatase CobN
MNNNGIVLLTHAGTDLSALERARAELPQDFAPVTGIHLQMLDSEAKMAALLAGPLAGARIVLLRLLGHANAIPGFEALIKHARSQGCHLIAVSGTGEPDPELAALSSAPTPVLIEATAYLQAGGTANMAQLLRFLADRLLMTSFGYTPPLALPEHGIYHPELAGIATLDDWREIANPAWPTVGIAFYRAHWVSGNTRFIDALVDALAERQVNALPVYTASLRTLDETGLPAALRFFLDCGVDALINTTSFAMGDVNTEGATMSGWSVAAFERLDVPVLQAITSSMTYDQWQQSPRGLNPLDTAMNVALPEFDGRSIGVPISFKRADSDSDATEYEPMPDRVARMAGIAARMVKLRRTPAEQKRIAFIFTNSNSKASQIGNAVGLDSPASLYTLLQAMQAQGYRIEDLPESSNALIHELIDRGAYDEDYLTADQLSRAVATVPAKRYEQW